MNNSDTKAIAHLQGTVERIVKDLETGRERMHDIASIVHRLDARVETLVETAVPQRERMINDLASIKLTLGLTSNLTMRVDEHGKKIDEHEAYKNRAQGMLALIGLGAGSAAYGVISLGKYLLGVKP